MEVSVKFEPGDIVECVGSISKQFTRGKHYIVKNTKKHSATWFEVFVEMDDSNSPTNGWNSRYFLLVQKNKHRLFNKKMNKLINEDV